MSIIDPNRLKQLAFFLILVAFGVILFLQMRTFLPAFLGAVTFYMLMRNSMQKLVFKRKWKKDWAAAILMLTSFLVVLIPIWALVSVLSSKVEYAMTNSAEVMQSVQQFAAKIQNQFHIKLLTADNITKVNAWFAGILPNILGATFNTLTSIAIMYFILYFMLTKTVELEDFLYEYIPLKDENIGWIGNELSTLVYSNALGVPLIALAQGIVALIGYLLIGAPDIMFWFIITSIAAMMPVIGAAAGYVPLSLVLFAQGQTWKGIAILAFGFLVVGITDNVFRIYLVRKLGDVHPLITVFGVIIGVNMFGFIGLIFGPILIAMFLLLIKIYTNEFGAKKVRNKVKA
ncbi:MAG: family transporter [Chitinophagaceae bacterium]|nr:family transporter [Chitinophagaceae bacterium]